MNSLIDLPRGITGFWHISEKPLSFIEKKEIEKLVSLINYPFVFNPKEINDPDHSSNFWRIRIENEKENFAFYLLINSCFWFCSAITINSQWMNLEFIDIPSELKDQLISANNNLICLTKESLNTEYKDDALANLGEAELKQIRYWKSKTYGEIIFNGYD